MQPTTLDNFKADNPNLVQNAVSGQAAQMPVSTTPTVMAADTLNAGTTPLKLNSPAPSTVGAGIIGAAEQSVVDFDKAAKEAEKVQSLVGDKAQIERNTMNTLAASLFGEKSDVLAGQVERENAAGIQKQQEALSGLRTEIANENVAYRAEQDKVRNSFASEAQKAVSMNSLSDTYGRRLADLAIREAAAVGNIAAIQTNAERQTKLLTAPLDNKLEFLKTFGKDNVDALTAEQNVKLGMIVKNVETQKSEIEALQKQKAAMIMEISNNGGGNDQATLRAIQNAKSPSEVAAAGSKYAGLIDRQLKQAQLSQIYNSIAESKAKALENQGGQGIVAGQKPIGKPDYVAAGFATRALESMSIADKVEASKTKGLTTSSPFTLRNAIPMIKPEEYKQYAQAQDNFIRAVLRKESGASISPEEIAGAQSQYFAQEGDTPAVLLQKQRNRADSTNALIGASGTAYNGTFLAKPVEFKGAKTQPVNAFEATLQMPSVAPIYNTTTGYVIPK